MAARNRERAKGSQRHDVYVNGGWLSKLGLQARAGSDVKLLCSAGGRSSDGTWRTQLMYLGSYAGVQKACRLAEEPSDQELCLHGDLVLHGRSWVQERWTAGAYGRLFWCILAWGKEHGHAWTGPRGREEPLKLQIGPRLGLYACTWEWSRHARGRKASQVGPDCEFKNWALLNGPKWACKKFELNPNWA